MKAESIGKGHRAHPDLGGPLTDIADSNASHLRGSVRRRDRPGARLPRDLPAVPAWLRPLRAARGPRRRRPARALRRGRPLLGRPARPRAVAPSSRTGRRSIGCSRSARRRAGAPPIRGRSPPGRCCPCPSPVARPGPDRTGGSAPARTASSPPWMPFGWQWRWRTRRVSGRWAVGAERERPVMGLQGRWRRRPACSCTRAAAAGPAPRRG